MLDLGTRDVECAFEDRVQVRHLPCLFTAGAREVLEILHYPFDAHQTVA